MKTLVVVAHPLFETSIVNKRWIQELDKHSDKFTVHNISTAYSTDKFDVAKEQKLIEQHGNLVFQFPLCWFNCPGILKVWLDSVLLYGWAYGEGAKAMKGRKIAVVTSAGGPREYYSKDKLLKITMEELLKPFKATAAFCEADYRSFYAFYGANKDTDQDIATLKVNLEKSIPEYIDFLNKI